MSLLEDLRLCGDQDAGQFRDGQRGSIRFAVQEIGDDGAGLGGDGGTLEEPGAAAQDEDRTR